eukprot:gene10047-biopygen1630
MKGQSIKVYHLRPFFCGGHDAITATQFREILDKLTSPEYRGIPGGIPPPPPSSSWMHQRRRPSPATAQIRAATGGWVATWDASVQRGAGAQWQKKEVHLCVLHEAYIIDQYTNNITV